MHGPKSAGPENVHGPAAEEADTKDTAGASEAEAAVASKNPEEYGEETRRATMLSARSWWNLRAAWRPAQL